jgi:hypothetical protein
LEVQESEGEANGSPSLLLFLGMRIAGAWDKAAEITKIRKWLFRCCDLQHSKIGTLKLFDAS